jgi:DNA-binding NarL/FixJ family response regulator
MIYNPINIIIADDHEIFLNGLKLLISDLPELHLQGEAANGKQLTEMVHKKLPDIVITDIKMPVMDGVEATRIIKKQHPNIGIIALSMFNEDDIVIDMLEAGARGYLLKNTNKIELLNAVKAIKNNSYYYCSATSEKLLRMIAETKFNPYKNIVRPKFSNRELQVMDLICKEYTSKEMAYAMNLSIRTIESYKGNIQEKIGAKNTTGIAVYAVKNNLIKEI